MKDCNAHNSFGYLAVLSGLALLLLMAPAVFAEEATIQGEVEVAWQDEEGNVTAVFLHDPEWGSVLISDAGKGHELLQHVGKQVEVAGSMEELGEDEEFDYEITVSSYTILDE
jgi:hypothetical protein